VALFADFFAPYHYDDEDVLYAWAPPARVHLFNANEKIIKPYVYNYTFSMNQYYQRIYSPQKDSILPIKLFVKGFEYKLLGLWNTDIHLFGVEGGRIHILGADLKGRDIFSRLLYGARISLSVGLIGVAIAFSIGMLVGGISGYFRGWVDVVLMRVVEMMMMVPTFYLMLALLSAFPPEIGSTKRYVLIVIILAFVSWAAMARVIRGISLSLREREFVLAAKALGVSDLKIIIRHILPHTFSYAIPAICLSVPGYILGEAALSLLGLGIQEPEASWGNMLALAQGIVSIRFYPWILFPGFCILIVTACYNVIGDALRDILDPKRKLLL
jgi:peptide/nickel transport system permease protein